MRLFAQIVESAQDAIFTLSLDGVVTSWNSAAAHLLGCTEAEVLGTRFEQPIGSDAASGLTEVLELVRTEGGLQAFDADWQSGAGEPVAVSAKFSPIFDSRGTTVGASVVARDVSESRRREAEREASARELESANTALGKSNEQLQHFAYVASHDLQAPLRHVVGFLGMLKRKHADDLDPKAIELIDRAVTASGRMSDLVRDLLKFARVESRAKEFRPVALDDALDEAIEGLSAMVQESGAEIGRTELPELEAERSQIVQLFQNLVANSLKFRSEATPRIDISARRVGSHWILSLSDNGIGIDSEHHEEVFEMFGRLHSAREYPGTGIGLALCQRIVDRHGGKIWVESEPGEGATFFVSLPAS